MPIRSLLPEPPAPDRLFRHDEAFVFADDRRPTLEYLDEVASRIGPADRKQLLSSCDVPLTDLCRAALVDGPYTPKLQFDRWSSYQNFKNSVAPAGQEKTCCALRYWIVCNVLCLCLASRTFTSNCTARVSRSPPAEPPPHISPFSLFHSSGQKKMASTHWQTQSTSCMLSPNGILTQAPART
jgi:hypothetical protein